MKWIIILILFVSTCSYSLNVYSGPLTKLRLESFSKHLLDVTRESPQSLYEHLSEKLEVETSIGSSAQGLTLYYNKAQYIKAIEQIIQNSEEKLKEVDVHIFDFIVHSKSNGQFTVTNYSKAIRAKVWTTYHVELKNNKLLITKILEST